MPRKGIGPRKRKSPTKKASRRHSSVEIVRLGTGRYQVKTPEHGGRLGHFIQLAEEAVEQTSSAGVVTDRTLRLRTRL